MNRIAETIVKFRAANKTMIVPYITPEFPVKEATVPLLRALEQSGAAMIEVGIPFSDPLADGPTIQRSSEIAIANGATLQRVLDIVKAARTSTSIPIILMGYINPILSYGFEHFCRNAAASGVDGVIVPDLPPEESDEFRSLCAQFGLSNIFLMAPTSSDERIALIDSLSTHFSYCVSMTGVTGTNNLFDTTFDDFLGRVKKNARKPFVVGFGVSTANHVKHISRLAHGAVVGSALLLAIEKKTTIEEITTAATHFVSPLVSL